MATQFLAKIFLIRTPENKFEFVLLVVSTVLIAASGYIVNDYFDVKIDLINKPDQVYVGRIIKRRYATLLHQSLSILGILFGAFVNWEIFLVNLLSVILLWFYASTFKKKAFLGNIVVAFLTSLAIFELTFIFAQNHKLVLVYAIFAFFMTLIREIIKDIEDIEGDKRHNAKTVPVQYGFRFSKSIIYLIFVLLFTSVLGFLILIKNQHLNIIFAILGIFTIFINIKIFQADRKSQFSKLSRYCKYFMILGILSMIAI